MKLCSPSLCTSTAGPSAMCRAWCPRRSPWPVPQLHGTTTTPQGRGAGGAGRGGQRGEKVPTQQRRGGTGPWRASPREELTSRLCPPSMPSVRGSLAVAPECRRGEGARGKGKVTMVITPWWPPIGYQPEHSVCRECWALVPRVQQGGPTLPCRWLTYLQGQGAHHLSGWASCSHPDLAPCAATSMGQTSSSPILSLPVSQGATRVAT